LEERAAAKIGRAFVCPRACKQKADITQKGATSPANENGPHLRAIF